MIREKMPVPGTPVLVALSGGADSVFLTLSLLYLGYPVTAAHCNYGLRPEAVEEEGFVVDFCNSLAITVEVRRFSDADMEDLQGEGLQSMARRLRYAFFEEVMAAAGIDHCATGHHADDQLESLVQSFFRSRGPQMFHPIPARRGAYFRPLLCLDRAEIEHELRAMGQSWRHDSSNDRLDYQRNRIRHQLLPLLSDMYPGFRERFRNQAQRQSGIWDLLDHLLRPLVPEIVQQSPEGEVVAFAGIDQRLGEGQRAAFLDWWLSSQGYAGVEIGEVQRLANSAVGATYICTRARILRDRRGLVLLPPMSKAGGEAEVLLELPAGTVHIRGWEIDYETVNQRPDRLRGDDPELHVLDADVLLPPLIVRGTRVGDKMQPYGMAGTRLVSDIFVDQKRSLPAKESAWVLEDREGIVLLGGYRIAHRVAVTPSTQRFLILRIRCSL